MTRKTLTVASMVAGLVLRNTCVQAQVVKKSALNGVIVSMSTAVPDDSTTHQVFMTPTAGNGVFILTQFCTTAPGIGNVTLSGGGITVVDSTNDECTAYTAGIAFPPATALTCLNGGTGSTETCMITGVLSKK